MCISDTHGLHRGVAVPRGDILIHCGDITNTGEPDQVCRIVIHPEIMTMQAEPYA